MLDPRQRPHQSLRAPRQRLLACLAASLWLGFAMPSAAGAQVAAPVAPPVRARGDSVRIAAWERDLNTLASELERLHPNLYFQRPKPEFANALGALRRAIPTSDDISLALGVQRLVASLGDGHTTASLDLVALGMRRIPIAAYVFDDGVYIRDADASLVSLIGARIVGIGSLPIDTVLARLRPYVAAETEAWALQMLPTPLVLAEVLREIGATASSDSVSLDVITREGSRQRLSVATMPVATEVKWSLLSLVPLDSLPLFRRNGNSNYWFEYLASERTMFIGYNRAANDTANPLDAFGARLEQELNRHDVARIIVDFRLNAGGNSSLFRAIERPVLAYKRAHPSTALVGVIGRRTFSSGLWNAIGFQRGAGATLYGESAGGRPNHFGEVRQFTLPHSGIRILHSTRRWRLVQDADPPALLPDVAVPVLASDHFALRDAVLSRILRAP